jgi:hypothetical protein
MSKDKIKKKNQAYEMIKTISNYKPMKGPSLNRSICQTHMSDYVNK